MNTDPRRAAAAIASAMAIALAHPGGAGTGPQASVLVKDICTNITTSSDPIGLTVVGDRIVFFAEDYLGEKVWATDGTDGGTVPLAEIPDHAPKTLGVVNGKLLFIVTDLDHGDEFWSTDGSPSGTSRFAVVDHTADVFAAREVTADAAYLIRPAGSGWGLWKADGSSVQLIAIVAPAATPMGSFFLVAVAGTVFFPGDDGVHGLELWHSDGTPAGTGMVADLWPGPKGSNPQASAAAAAGSRLFFVAANDQGCQPWVTDGTGGGTHLVKAFAGGKDCSSAPVGLTAVGTVVLFGADDGGKSAGLWRSDGTEAGTALVTAAVTVERPLGVIGDVLVFSGRDPAHGPELWRTDGTAAGTRLVADLDPGPNGIAQEGQSLASGGKVYLSLVVAPSNDFEPWVTDGTAAGTFRLADINAGEGGSDPIFGATLGATVLFSANDYTHGRELWRTDGTPGSTRLVRDVNAQNNGSAPFDFTAVPGTLLFLTVDCTNGFALWRSDGSGVGTVRLDTFRDLPIRGAGGEFLVRGGDRVFFIADDGLSGTQIWTSDGTAEGTKPFVDLAAGGLANPLYPFWWQGVLYFVATDGAGRLGLWRSDGTQQGTSLVAEMPGNGVSPSPNWIVGLDRRLVLLLCSSTISGAYDLWTSDGTPGGTCLVKASDGRFFLDAGVALPKVLGQAVFFLAYDDIHYHELWRTDGTPEGTAIVSNVLPDTEAFRDASPSGLSVVHGRLVFLASDGVHGWEPWTSDGTPEGTRMVADIVPGSESSNVESTFGFLEGPGDTFYFTASVPGHGRNLWVSDFSQAGTHVVADLLEPPLSLDLLDGHALGPWFFFSFTPVNAGAPDYVYPTYLFVTQGTADTTSEVTGAWPPDIRRTLSRLETFGSCLYFCGGDKLHAQELWKACPPMEHPVRRHVSRAP